MVGLLGGDWGWGGSGRGLFITATVTLSAEEVGRVCCSKVRVRSTLGDIVLGQPTVTGLSALETELSFIIAISIRRQLLGVKSVVDVGGAGEWIVVSPVCAGLRLLVEQCARGTEEPEVPDPSSSDPHAHVEGLAAGLSVCIVRAQDPTFTVEPFRAPYVTCKENICNTSG